MISLKVCAEQGWMLAPEIEQCPTKNWAMLDNNYFTMHTVIQRAVNFF